MSNSMITRPPVGFIVEGDGEYNCYPSLFCRIVNITKVSIPIVNAGGCGSLIMNLEEQLNSLMEAHDPLSVIITVDHEDAIKQKLANSTQELLIKLDQSIQEWKSKANKNERFHTVPEQIVSVLQIRKFESWMISDLDGLEKSGLLRKNITKITDADGIERPSDWIKKNVLITGSVKKPITAKKVITALDPQRMRLHSHSFNKFYQESVNAYSRWEERISQQEEMK